MASVPPLTAAKQQLRRVMKQKLSSIPSESITAQSHQICEALKSFKPYRDARRISIYLSMPSGEVQTDAIVRHALESGKQVFVPYLHKSPLQLPNTPSRVMDMVRLTSLQDYESLSRDKWGIPSIDPATVDIRQRILGETRPGAEAQTQSESTTPKDDGLDLMLMPGVAFDVDEAGSLLRLGHGKGFYDFFINRYTSRHAPAGNSEAPMLLYALALTEQLISPAVAERIPVGPFDRSLDGLVLGSGIIKESASRRESVVHG